MVISYSMVHTGCHCGLNLCRDPADWGTLCVRLVPTWEALLTEIWLCFALYHYKTPLGYARRVRQRFWLFTRFTSKKFKMLHEERDDVLGRSFTWIVFCVFQSYHQNIKQGQQTLTTLGGGRGGWVSVVNKQAYIFAWSIIGDAFWCVHETT